MDSLTRSAIGRARAALDVAAGSAPPAYSLSAVLKAAVANDWNSLRSNEKREHDRLCELAGPPPPSRRTLVRIPGHALRDMTVAGVSGSNYLSPSITGEYIESLTGDSAALRLGVGVVPVPRGTSAVIAPKGTAGATAYWITDENTQITESQPTLGQVAASSKTLAAFTQLSHQMLTQAPNAENVIRTELRRAAGAALDAAIFAGTGAGGSPTGVTGWSGTGAFSGSTLAMAALRNAQTDLLTAKAITDPSKLAYVTTPAVAETLSTRARATGSDRMVWEGASHEGVMEGLRAIASVAMPTGTCILGDWSAVQVLEFSGGLLLEVDPFSAFSTGVVSVRLLLDLDLLPLRPAAFSIATSVT